MSLVDIVQVNDSFFDEHRINAGFCGVGGVGRLKFLSDSPAGGLGAADVGY